MIAANGSDADGDAPGVRGASDRVRSTESGLRPLRDIVHDFNNLLAAIQGYGALLIEDLPEGSTERLFALNIATATDSAKALVAELSILARSQLARREQGDVPAATAGATQAKPDRKTRVLVVDDEPAIAELVARMLTRAGYDSHWRCSPRDALDAFRNDADGWDVVVSDQTMPDMTGAELAAMLKAIDPAIPVVLCTGHDASDVRQLAPAVSAFLVKPASRDQLDQAIKAALKRGGTEKALAAA